MKMKFPILLLHLFEGTSGCLEWWDRKRRETDEHSGHSLISGAMLPFAYCLQADKDVMTATVLAGMDGIVFEDSFDPFCHQECQPDNDGLYDMESCMACYKNEDNLNNIIDKYEAAGGGYRVRPTISQIQRCLNRYLPTLLTDMEPEIIQTWEDVNAISGYISVPEEIHTSYVHRINRSEDREPGSDFWKLVLSPKNPNCHFTYFNFHAGYVLNASESHIHLGYSIEQQSPNIDYNITFDENCEVEENATSLWFDKSTPSPVLPRFYSINRSDENYDIEFGWDNIGYMYVLGDATSDAAYSINLQFPCDVGIDDSSSRYVSYKSEIMVEEDDLENDTLSISYYPLQRSPTPDLEVLNLTLFKLSDSCQMSPIDIQMRTLMNVIVNRYEGSDANRETSGDYSQCIPERETPPSCKNYQGKISSEINANKVLKNAHIKALINQANKAIKNSPSESITCDMYLACEIRLQFIGLDGDALANCPNGKECFEIEISSGCVSVTDTEACLEYADEEVAPDQNGVSHTFHRSNSKQNFYYAWYHESKTLQGSFIKNQKKLKIEAKQQVNSIIKNNFLVDD